MGLSPRGEGTPDSGGRAAVDADLSPTGRGIGSGGTAEIYGHTSLPHGEGAPGGLDGNGRPGAALSPTGSGLREPNRHRMARLASGAADACIRRAPRADADRVHHS